MATSTCIEGDEGWLLVFLAISSLLSSYLIARAVRHADAIRVDCVTSYKDFLEACTHLPPRWAQAARPVLQGVLFGCFLQGDSMHALSLEMTCDGEDVIGYGTDGEDTCSFRGQMNGDALHGTLRFGHGRPKFVRVRWVDEPRGTWPIGWYGVCIAPFASAASVCMLCDRELNDDIRAKCRELNLQDPWRQPSMRQFRNKKSLYELLFPPSASAAPMIASVLHSRTTVLVAGAFLATCIVIVVNGSIATLSSGLPAVYGGWWAALLSATLFVVSSAYCGKEGYRWRAGVQMLLWLVVWLLAMSSFIVSVLFDYHAMAVTANAKVCKKGMGVIEKSDWAPSESAELVVEPSCEMVATCTCLHVDTCDASKTSGTWTAECLVFEPYDNAMSCEGSAEMIAGHMSLSIALCVFAMLLCIAFLCLLPAAVVHHNRKKVVQNLLYRFEHSVLDIVSSLGDADREHRMLEEGNQPEDDETDSLLTAAHQDMRDEPVLINRPFKPLSNSKGIQRRRWLGRFRAEHNNTSEPLALDGAEGNDIELIDMTAHQDELIPSSMFEASRLGGIDKRWPHFDDDE